MSQPLSPQGTSIVATPMLLANVYTDPQMLDVAGAVEGLVGFVELPATR